MGDWQNFDNRAVIGKALRLRREIDDFEAKWPTPAAREEALPTFTWDQLERQLIDLAATPAQAALRGDLGASHADRQRARRAAQKSLARQASPQAATAVTASQPRRRPLMPAWVAPRACV